MDQQQADPRAEAVQRQGAAPALCPMQRGSTDGRMLAGTGRWVGGGMTSAPSSSLAFIKVKQTALTMGTTKQMGRESTRTGFS